MTRSQRNLWLLATVVFAVCITVAALSYIVTEPWHAFPELGGDGAKNGFTYLYHSMYGKGYWFTGMNYPYGEHIVFTDGIPLLSVFFAAIGNVSAGTALTTLWWLVGLGYILSVVYVYKTLLRYDVAPWAAMLLAGVICILTPQWVRIRGHYALSITCFLPMLLYWSVCWQQERHWRYWLYVFIAGSLFSFIHPYYAGVSLIWVALFCIGFLLFERRPFATRARLLLAPMLAGVGIPALVMVVMKLTDPATDRLGGPPMPYEVYTNLWQVFTSYFSPFWEVAVNKGIVPVAADGGEGYSYIGLVPIAVLLLLWPVYRFARKHRPAPSFTFPVLWLFVAVAALLFSMGFPLRWEIPLVSKAFFFLKQFRTLGRFSWIFYYIVAVFSAVSIYRWWAMLVASGRRLLAHGLLSLALLVWGCEALGYIKASRYVADHARYNYDVIFSVHEQKWPEFLQAHGHKADDFQAILGLRLFHVGTDKIWVGDPGWLVTLGSRASLQLHLPMIDAMMARSSLGTAQKLVKIAAGPFAEKPLLQDLKGNKPFLLLDYDMDPLSADQRYLLEASDLIGEFSSCRVYACYPERIVANDKKHTDSVARLLSSVPVGDTCIGCNGTWYAAHYEEHARQHSLRGGGALRCIRGDDSLVAVIPVQLVGDSIMYEFSCWYLLGNEDYRSPVTRLEFMDTTGKRIGEITVNTSESVDSRGMWFRASKYFYIPKACNNVRCSIGNIPNPAYIAMDELLLRPSGAMVLSKGADGSVMVNNHWFR